jgi:zinc/manganese transport system substrate-binding protein
MKLLKNRKNLLIRLKLCPLGKDNFMRKSYIKIAILVVIILASAAFVGLYFANPSSSSSTPNSTSSKIQIVAAENFWGSLVSQLGGTHVQVLSIVTDPNADPHEYESNSADAQAIASASLVIINGAGYDEWALKLIAASDTPNQVVLNVQELLNQSTDANPHFWYDPSYVNETVHQMYLDLVSIEPAVGASLAIYNGRIDEIRQQFAGTEVASTESIFEYLANATGLNLVSPPAFMQAVSEGNDPPAQSVVQFQQQLQSGNVSVLVYNEQTVTPLTQSMKLLATQNNVTVVGITETIQPPDLSFQDWMNAEMITLQNALSANTLGNRG